MVGSDNCTNAWKSYGHEQSLQVRSIFLSQFAPIHCKSVARLSLSNRQRIVKKCKKVHCLLDNLSPNHHREYASLPVGIFQLDGGQNLERPNVERKFRKFETSNIEITKVELFDFSISEFIFYFYDCLNDSNTQNTYLIINHRIRMFSNFDSFTNCQILKIC